MDVKIFFKVHSSIQDVFVPRRVPLKYFFENGNGNGMEMVQPLRYSWIDHNKWSVTTSLEILISNNDNEKIVSTFLSTDSQLKV